MGTWRPDVTSEEVRPRLGYLVIGADGSVTAIDDHFFALWNLPPRTGAPPELAALLAELEAQVADRAGFVASRDRWVQGGAPVADEVELADGRRLRRLSASIEVPTGPGARLHLFEDVTARRALERRAFELAEDIRRAIARDLHSGVGQALSATSMLVGLLEPVVPPTYADVAHDAMVAIEQASLETRRLLLCLSEVDLGLEAPDDDLRRLATAATQATGVPCEVVSDVELAAPMSHVDRVQIYRLAQDALALAAPRGFATHARLVLVRRGPGFLLEVHGLGGSTPRPPEADDHLERLLRYRSQILRAVLSIRKTAEQRLVRCYWHAR